MIKTCVICNNEFTTNIAKQICCSKKCGNKRHYLKSLENDRFKSLTYGICKTCGENFIPKGKERFCSEECREKTRKESQYKFNATKKEKNRLKKQERNERKEKLKLIEQKNRIWKCIFCGKEFTGYKRLYCSIECRKEAQNTRDRLQRKSKPKEPLGEINCKLCSKAFAPIHKRQVYCSKECALQADKKNRAASHQKRRAKRYAICSICGKEFIISKHFIKYCSEDCKDLAKQQKRKPEYIEKECIVCGDKFLTKPRSTLCCSDKCHKKYRVQVQTEYNIRKTKRELEEKIQKQNNIKLEQELNRQQNKEKFIKMFLENIEGNYRCDIDNYRFIVLKEDKWVIKVEEIQSKISYQSDLNSNLYFDDKLSAINYCYEIFKGDKQYIEDFQLYFKKHKKIEEIKNKVVISKRLGNRLFNCYEAKGSYEIIKINIQDILSKQLKRKYYLNDTLCLEFLDLMSLSYDNSDCLIDKLIEFIANIVHKETVE